MAESTVDIIFAGGGTTACVVAGRLAAADPTLNILIIEAGKHSENVKNHIQPARYCNNFRLGDSFTFHVAEPSASLDGRKSILASGKAVGGGSAVNYLDDWEKLGNTGWGSTDLIPLANKAEAFQPTLPGHGSSGPISVTAVSSLEQIESGVGEQFLAVAAVRDSERKIIPDSNNLSASTINNYSPWSRYVSPQTGKRSDTAHHYIYNQGHNTKNIQILTCCRVKRVMFRNKRAIGVEYFDHHSETVDPRTALTAYASKLVVLSSGVFGSSAILERSGIGARPALEALGIPVIAELPGVGENYNDHVCLLPPYRTSDDEITLDEIFYGTDQVIKPYEDRWLQDGQGLMAHNGNEAGIKIRPNEQDLRMLGSDFSPRWETFFKTHPDKPIMCFAPAAYYAGLDSEARRHKHFSMLYYADYPASVGSTHIQSTDPYFPLSVRPGYLDKAEDVALLRWGYKWTREMARRMNSYRGEFAPDHPHFPAGSQATCGFADGPIPVLGPDIKYTAEDDKAIDAFHRARAQTTWHGLGTCAMKPRELGGVVDARLSVYGVEGLKIADLSIAPTNVSTNTYSTALMIGEKAAVLFAEELGISGV
ncbi:GMC-OxRdtase-N domain-containing protein [Mycena indigotica]|uniref:GMC-OxRdtase-N domain-containing protein n=1 Tax=Mycena indigotica TaxID=2126181 RepID=A0A8H6WHG8_9AGAR|nr:GMC-OxRdtase-N domain-containing protein [Mycena indigotica]KAF7312459.1 GMC-OxRdtase-N domain-containing protein [Mycena indigotica]